MTDANASFLNMAELCCVSDAIVYGTLDLRRGSGASNHTSGIGNCSLAWRWFSAKGTKQPANPLATDALSLAICIALKSYRQIESLRAHHNAHTSNSSSTYEQTYLNHFQS